LLRAYNAELISEEPDNTPALGESERFALPPQGGYVAMVNVYLSDTSEVSSQGGVKALAVGPFVFARGVRTVNHLTYNIE
jgi:hypothetical protein